MDISAAALNGYDNTRAASQMESLKAAGRYSEKEITEMKEACDNFEALFIKIMLDSMKATVPERSLFGKNQGEEYFEDMLYDEYAKSMSQTDSFGISDAMYRQMTTQMKGGLYS